MHFCLNLYRVNIYFKTCKSENIKVISGNQILKLVLKRSADPDNKLAVIIHGNVWYVNFCMNMPREDIFHKIICWQLEFHI